MKMMKVLLLLILILPLFSISAVCEDNDYYDRQLEASGAEKIIGVLPDDTLKLMEQLGIDGFDYRSILSSSPRKIADMFFELIRNEYSLPLKSLFSICAVTIIYSIVKQFAEGLASLGKAVEVTACGVVVISLLSPLAAAVSRAAAAIELSGNLMLVMIPVLAGIVAVSGSPSTALSYNTLAFIAAQFTCLIGKSVVTPLTKFTLSLGILSSVVNEINLGTVVELIKKTSIFLMSISSTLFVTMLTLKGMLAAAADTVAVRGVRFLIGRLIPVVGGAVSDGFYSIAGSLSLIKNTVGIYSIIAVALINLPIIIECLMWILTLFLGSAVSEMFGCESITSVMKAISGAVVLLMITVLFSAVIIILSTGLLLLIKGESV